MIGERLKYLRKLKGMPQKELASHLNVSQQAVGSWEVGRTQPDDTTLSKISIYFGVPISFLLGTKPFENWNQIQKHIPEIIASIKEFFRSEDPFKKFGVSEEGIPLNRFITLLSSFVDHIDIDEKTNEFHIYYFIDDKKVQKKEPVTERDRLVEETNELFSKLPLDKKKQALEYLRFLVEQQGKQ